MSNEETEILKAMCGVETIDSMEKQSNKKYIDRETAKYIAEKLKAYGVCCDVALQVDKLIITIPMLDYEEHHLVTDYILEQEGFHQENMEVLSRDYVTNNFSARYTFKLQ